MKFHKVTDGKWTDGYYLNKDTAQQKADETNQFIEENKDKEEYKNMSSDKWFVEEIETED